MLQGLTGALKPGRLTLLLGPPGSGKSLLLRALSGRLQGVKDVHCQGSVRYNGHDALDLNIQRTASYVEQNDLHLPLLTVRT